MDGDIPKIYPLRRSLGGVHNIKGGGIFNEKEIFTIVNFFPDTDKLASWISHKFTDEKINNPLEWAKDVIILLERMFEIHINNPENNDIFDEKTLIKKLENLNNWKKNYLDIAIKNNINPYLLNAYKYITQILKKIFNHKFANGELP